MKPDYVDVHTHLNFAAFEPDRERVIRRTLEAGVWAINVGTQAATSHTALTLARTYDGLFAAVGLHPIHTAKSFHDTNELGEGGAEFTSREEVFDMDLYRSMAADKKVVAIGECGLDYFRLEPDTKVRQQEIFLQQIQLANELEKPLMLHIRNAYADAYALLKANARVPANLHFFAGTLEDAKPFLELGCSFSFTGVITFTHNYDEVIKFLPLDRIMSETDAPYVAPEPHRGKRNEPRFVAYVVERLAAVKGMPAENVRTHVAANAGKFFGL